MQEREREKERGQREISRNREIFYGLFQVKLKSGGRNFSLVSCVSDRYPSTKTFLLCFPRHVERELESKQSI